MWVWPLPWFIVVQIRATEKQIKKSSISIIQKMFNSFPKRKERCSSEQHIMQGSCSLRAAFARMASHRGRKYDAYSGHGRLNNVYNCTTLYPAKTHSIPRLFSLIRFLFLNSFQSIFTLFVRYICNFKDLVLSATFSTYIFLFFRHLLRISQRDGNTFAAK